MVQPVSQFALANPYCIIASKYYCIPIDSFLLPPFLSENMNFVLKKSLLSFKIDVPMAIWVNDVNSKILMVPICVSFFLLFACLQKKDLDQMC